MENSIFALISSGDAATLRGMLRADPSLVQQKDDNGLSPLHRAASAGDAGMVRSLLEAGADVQAPDRYGYPPINSAVWDGHSEVVDLLITQLDPDSDAARSLLTMAAGRGHEEIVRRALDAGVAVDADDGMGQTALVHALRGGREAVARLLLGRGARVDLELGASGETPLSMAKDRELTAVVELIEARGGVAQPPEEKTRPFPNLASPSRRLKGATPITQTRAKRILRGLHAFGDADERLHVYLFDGDRHRRGNLELNADEMLIVTGNLTVDGALIDDYYNEDDRSQLYILGDLTAGTLVTGSPIHVQGNVEVHDVLYANSFGLDALTIGGTLRAGVIIDEGHEIACSRIEAGKIYASEHQLPTWSAFPRARKLQARLFAERKLYKHGTVDPEILYQRASEGLPIVTMKVESSRKKK
jgi:ankyrin repeat protein